MAFTPGGSGSTITITNWTRRILGALYDVMQCIPNSEKVGDPIEGQLYVRRMGRVATQTLSSTNDGTTVTFSDPAPTRTAMTPAWILAAISYPDSLRRQAGEAVDSASADTLDLALAAGLDAYVLQQAAASTVSFGNNAYDVEPAGLRTALTTLLTNSYGNAKAGELMLLLDSGQVAPSLAIPELNNAYQRGDGTSPVVTGRMSTGVGFKFGYSTLCYFDANGHHGIAWKKQAIQYGYNQEPRPERQRYIKQNRLMVDAEIAATIVFNEMLIDIRHK